MKIHISKKDLSRIKTALVYFGKGLNSEKSISEYIYLVGIISDLQEELIREDKKVFIVLEKEQGKGALYG